MLSDRKKRKHVMLSDFWLRRAKNRIEAYACVFCGCIEAYILQKFMRIFIEENQGFFVDLKPKERSVRGYISLPLFLQDHV